MLPAKVSLVYNNVFQLYENQIIPAWPGVFMTETLGQLLNNKTGQTWFPQILSSISFYQVDCCLLLAGNAIDC